MVIDHPEAEELAHAVATATGETLTDAVMAALRERLARLERTVRDPDLQLRVAEVQAFVGDLPDRDARHPDAVIGYDEFGLPG